MKKCTYCGKEYLDEVDACQADGHPLVTFTPKQAPEPAVADTVPSGYESVPWYRRDSTAGVALWLGFLCFAPALWALGLICLTGDIYYPTTRTRKSPPKWSTGSKIRVWILIIVQALVLVWVTQHQKKVLSK